MTTYLNPSTRSGGVEQIVVPERQSAVPVDDAPFDDEQYVRVNGEWVPYTAPPIIPDTLAPKPPTGLGATGTMAGNGSSVDYALRWDAPSQNTDGSPLTDFAYYVVRWRYGLGGVYQSFTTKDTTFLLPGLVPNKDVEWGVVARDFSGNDSAWAEALIDGLADTEPPAKPNPPELSSRLGTLIVVWDGTLSGGAPPPADFDHLEVYMSATTGGPWTPVGRLNGAGMVVAAGLPVGETRYVTTVAVDTSGNASTRSDESSILITGVTGPDLEANSVTANAIEAGAIGAQQLSAVIAVLSKLCSSEEGRRWEADQEGIRVYDDTGAVIVNFPTDLSGGGNTIKGDLTATALTVQDYLTIQGLVNEVAKGSRLVLSSGTTSPPSAPTLTLDWENYGPTKDATFDQYRQGLAFYNAKYYYTVNVYGGNAKLERMTASTGAREVYSKTLSVIRTAYSLTVMGTTAYILGSKADGTWAVEKWNLTTDTSAGSWAWSRPSLISNEPAIGNDGTNILIGYSTTDGTVMWLVLNANTGDYVSEVVTNYSSTRGVVGLIRGNFDYGSARVVLQFKDATDFVVFNTAGVRQANDGWNVATGAKPRGITWDSTRGQFVSYDPVAAKLHFYTGTKWTTESATWWASYTWANPSTSSETAQSARRSITMAKRARLLVTVPARPVSDASITHNRVYLGRGSSDPARTAMWKQGADFAGTTQLLSSVAFSGSNPPSASSFSSSAPARLESAAGSLVLNGDGSGTAGGLAWGATPDTPTTISGSVLTAYVGTGSALTMGNDITKLFGGAGQQSSLNLWAGGTVNLISGANLHMGPKDGLGNIYLKTQFAWVQPDYSVGAPGSSATALLIGDYGAGRTGEPSLRIRRRTSDDLHTTEIYSYAVGGTVSQWNTQIRRDGSVVNQFTVKDDGRAAVNGRNIPIFATGQTANLPAVAGGAFYSVTVNFPAGRFDSAPKVNVNASSARLVAAARAVTATSFTLEVANWSTASTGTSEYVQWQAIQE